MAIVLTRDEILASLEGIDMMKAMEDAFVAYSDGRAVVPIGGELLFDDPPGDAHIKYGYRLDGDIFVVKVATGFYENAAKGLPSNSGMVVAFDRRTGFPIAIMLDEGELTSLRTAAAGAVAAKHLANAAIETVAVLGSGVQARLQIEFLGKVRQFKNVRIWSRRTEGARTVAEHFQYLGYSAEVVASPADAARGSHIVVTATASTKPLLYALDIEPGTHVTAMGSDTTGKRELAGDVLAKASLVVADSRNQCAERGEIHQACREGYLAISKVVELGDIISGQVTGREDTDQITVVDLTGVAVQDIAIAQAVLRSLNLERLAEYQSL
jgi:ornithine cyclodeaminase